MALRIGIIGLGKMGRIRARELSNHPDAIVVAGADCDPARALEFPGIRFSLDYMELVRSVDIDALFVCTPNAVSPDVVVAGLRNGKHVFCEKPPGRSLPEVYRIEKAQLQNPSLKLKFGFNHRYHPAITSAKQVVQSQRLGKLLWMRGIYGKAGGTGFESEWRNSKDLAGGGILLDQGIHMIDLFRFFCGDFVEIKSMCARLFWDIEVEDNAFALLRDTEGRIAMLHSSSTQWRHQFKLDICLSGGLVSVDGLVTPSQNYGEESLTILEAKDGFPPRTTNSSEQTFTFDQDPSWRLEINEFLESIRRNTQVLNGQLDDALKAMELVFAIYGGDEWHRPVSQKDRLFDFRDYAQRRTTK